MSGNSPIWDKYCSFFDLPVEQQVAYNRDQKDQLFEAWKDSQGAKALCGGSLARFEDIPPTTYIDYPVLKEFGQSIEGLAATNPRDTNQSLWDYYKGLGRQAARIVEDWLPDEFGYAVKTSGTSGTSKWYVHGNSFLEVATNNIAAFFVWACSDKWGRSSLPDDAQAFPVVGPTPYSGGVAYEAIRRAGWTIIPPQDIVDNEPDMRKKIMIALDMIEKGEKVDIAGGLSSPFHLACRYFIDRPGLFRDMFQSVRGPKKALLFIAWMINALKGNKFKQASEVMPVKGISVAGIDSEIYEPYFEDQFGVTPHTVYGSTETGFPLIGTPGQGPLFPLLNAGYLEFIDSDGRIAGVREVKEGETYELAYTPYRSILFRYCMGDLFTVVGHHENGLPLFRFESRKADLLDILNYYRLSESIAVQSLVAAGLPPTEKWAFVKETEPEEHICLLMEKEWEHSEQETSRRVFEAMRKIDTHFNDYAEHLKINDPWKAIRVEYLPKGAFMRYVMVKSAGGAELGQVKPLKLITPANREVAELLRKV